MIMRSLSMSETLSEQKSTRGIGIQGFVQSNGGLADARFFRVWIALWVAFWPELRHFCPMAPDLIALERALADRLLDFEALDSVLWEGAQDIVFGKEGER